MSQIKLYAIIKKGVTGYVGLFNNYSSQVIMVKKISTLFFGIFLFFMYPQQIFRGRNTCIKF